MSKKQQATLLAENKMPVPPVPATEEAGTAVMTETEPPTMQTRTYEGRIEHVKVLVNGNYTDAATVTVTGQAGWDEDTWERAAQEAYRKRANVEKTMHPTIVRRLA
jgi:hypothetical protein